MRGLNKKGVINKTPAGNTELRRRRRRRGEKKGTDFPFIDLSLSFFLV